MHLSFYILPEALKHSMGIDTIHKNDNNKSTDIMDKFLSLKHKVNKIRQMIRN